MLDRMAIDFAQMLKRTDVDYYVKGSAGYIGHGRVVRDGVRGRLSAGDAQHAVLVAGRGCEVPHQSA